MGRVGVRTAYFWNVAHGLPIDMSLSRVERLNHLLAPLDALLAGELSGMANLANVAAAISSVSQWHWVGFYMVDHTQDNLVLGPFQGPVACTRLFRGKGVCAKAWETGTTVVAPDVHAFSGHVACSASSKSEVVLPLVDLDLVVQAVLDIDSDEEDDFTVEEVAALERLTQLVSSQWSKWTW